MVLSFLLLIAFAGASTPAPAVNVTVLAVEPLDGTAVIRLGEELLVVKEGDEVAAANLPAAGGARFRIAEVLPDRLVLEATTDKPGGGSRDLRRVWLFKPEKPGGASRVQALETSPPSLVPMRQPPRPLSTQPEAALEAAAASGAKVVRSRPEEPDDREED